MNIYVGNLNFDTDEDGMRTEFEKHGTVDRVNLIYNRDTGRSRGFGFVEMPNDDEARAAMNALNGTQLDGRTLTVNEARPRTPRGGGGGGRGRGGGGGGYGGGRGRGGGGGYDRDRDRTW